MTFLLSLLLLSCSGNPDGLAIGDITSLRVEPAELSLVTRPDQPAEAEFVSIATMKDGDEFEMDLISWSLSNLSTGEIDEDGWFEAVDTNGGISDVISASLGVEGSARLTVIFSTDIMVDDLSTDIASAFASSSPSDDSQLQISYPFAEVIVPRNLEGLGFSWLDPSMTAEDVYRLHFQSEITDISVYTSNLQWVSSSSLWEMISAANRDGLVFLTIEAASWDGSSISDHRKGEVIELNVNRFDARGSVLYWGILEETHTASIQRIPIGTVEPETFWTCEGNNCCIGCHALSEESERMALTHNGGKFSVLDISDPSSPEEVIPLTQDRTNVASFKAISPDGQYMLGVEGPKLILYNLLTGERLKDINFPEPVSHPDWSPDGSQITFVRVTGSAASDMEFKGGEIVQADFNFETLDIENEVVLKERDTIYNYHYPAYSPDGEWIAYNRSSNDYNRIDSHFGCYAAPDAELWLMSRDGLIDIRLDRANGDGALQNSYPRWGPLPDDDVLWLAFSSRREYALDPSIKPQIWIVGINPELAKEGEDPSATPIWLPGQVVGNDNHLPVWWSK